MVDGGGAAGKSGGEGPWVHIRREPFEFGLLPIPSIMHKEGAVEVLRDLRRKLLEASSTDSEMTDARINSKAIATCLNLPQPQALLVLGSLASVLPVDTEDVDPLAQAGAMDDVDSIGADVDHLMLFLFIQSYRKAAHRQSYRDPTVTADVWPQGPSPFDSVSPTAASALQLKTSLAARQRSLPGQLEEEANQLAYVQKNLGSLLALLAEKNEAGEEVLSIDRFDFLGLLLRVNRIGSSSTLLSSVAPFFSNSDPHMPPTPVLLATVQSWLAPRLCVTSDHGPDLPPLSPRSADVADVAMQDTPSTPTGAGVGAGTGAMDADVAGGDGARTPTLNGLVMVGRERRGAWVGAGMTSIDGIAKMSILKGENEVENGTVRVSHCHDSVIYILAPLKYATVVGCSDSVVVLGPASKGVRVETCERVQVIVPCARIKISNCRESVFYIGTNSPPVIFGDNPSIKLAPYNTFYPKLDYHLAKASVNPSLNCWDQPLFLSSSDPHDPSSPRAGSSMGETASEAPVLLPPEKFVPFVVPFRSPPDQSSSNSSILPQQQTRSNPFHLPKLYLTALQQKTKTVENLRQTLKNAVLEENKKKELTNVIQAHFKEWLLTSGNIRQIYDLARLDRDP